jgi:environmental stress-induced protein Ves
MRVIKKTDQVEMPWKNGKGLTREIDRVSQPASNTDTFCWRLSLATISEPGPFSKYEGFGRWLVVWQGDGLKLNETLILPEEPHRFEGEDAISCEPLSQVVTDIGLIFNRDQVDAEMKIVKGPTTVGEGIHYIISKQSFDFAKHRIEDGDTLKIEGPAELTVERALLISLKLRAKSAAD